MEKNTNNGNERSEQILLNKFYSQKKTVMIVCPLMDQQPDRVSECSTMQSNQQAIK